LTGEEGHGRLRETLRGKEMAMAGLLENLMEIGLGALTLTREKAERIVEQLVKLKEIPQEKGHEVLQRLMEKGREAREELGQLVRREVNEALEKAAIARTADIERLEQRIAALEERVAALEKGHPG